MFYIPMIVGALAVDLGITAHGAHDGQGENAEGTRANGHCQWGSATQSGRVRGLRQGGDRRHQSQWSRSK